jgi:hypothetical protein
MCIERDIAMSYLRKKKPLKLDGIFAEQMIKVSDKRKKYSGLSYTRKRMSVFIEELELDSVVARRPREKSGPKHKYRRVRTQVVWTKQAKSKPASRPRDRPVLKIGKTRSRPVVERADRKARVYEPSPEEIKRMTDVMRELKSCHKRLPLA